MYVALVETAYERWSQAVEGLIGMQTKPNHHRSLQVQLDILGPTHGKQSQAKQYKAGRLVRVQVPNQVFKKTNPVKLDTPRS
jgi:hypothetical protein